MKGTSFSRFLKTRILRSAWEDETERLMVATCRLINRSELKPAGSLLDIGCADGAKTLEYARILKTENVAGVDASDKYISEVSDRMQIDKVDMECDSLPYQDESFDFIIINQVLEHLKNVFWAMAETDRVLKPGGHLLIGIPNLSGLHNRILLLFGRQPICMHFPGPHIRGFSWSAMKNFLITNSNYSLIDSVGSSLYPIPYPLSEFLAKLFPSVSAYALYLIKKEKSVECRSPWMKSGDYGDTNYNR